MCLVSGGHVFGVCLCDVLPCAYVCVCLCVCVSVCVFVSCFECVCGRTGRMLASVCIACISCFQDKHIIYIHNIRVIILGEYTLSLGSPFFYLCV